MSQKNDRGSKLAACMAFHNHLITAAQFYHWFLGHYPSYAGVLLSPLEAHLVVSGLPQSSSLIRQDVALTPPTDDVST
jgi:hypothetical protein